MCLVAQDSQTGKDYALKVRTGSIQCHEAEVQCFEVAKGVYRC